MLKNLLDRNVRMTNKAMKVVAEINALESEVSSLSSEQIKETVIEMRQRLQEIVKSLPPEAFYSLKTFNRGLGLQATELEIYKQLMQELPKFYALMREVMKRKMNRRHFDVQLAAGVILAEGQKLGEIKTGEGKTQIFYLPTFLYALTGRGAHSITVNDYLARRDGEYAGHVAAELGMTVGIIASSAAYKFVPDDKLAEVKGIDAVAKRKEMGEISLSGLSGINLVECSKREAYDCDITFATNNELGFDYLRDNMVWNAEDMVQRELYYCVVDEADSVLIDEARTPLIISAPGEASADLYTKFAKMVEKLEEEKDYKIDYKTRSATLTEEGIDRASQLIGVNNIWEDYRMAHHLENALKAKALFIKDDHYIIRDGEILIVDQFTGRVLPGRRYSEGLHQAIEAKEGVKIQDESRTFATISFQNLFRLYKVLIGGSGTIETEKEEFFKIYGLDTVVVPTNRPVIRKDERDRIYKNQQAKFKAVALEVKERYEHGQPVLVGTTSIDKSEAISHELDQIGVPHQVLNAKYHEMEAQIVAKAGEKQAVTVATNMAGRGTDIPLGEGVVELGGLAVIGTERHEARRIDNQLRGRSGRQGDPGYSRFYVAMDDLIMKMLGGDILGRLMDTIKVPDDQPIELGLISKRIEDAQRRVEWSNFDARKSLVEYDDVMNQQREIFYTRRRQFLTLAEQSIGRFRRGSQVINIANLSKSEQSEYKDKQLQSQQELKSTFTEMFIDEVEAIILDQFADSSKIDDEAVKNIVAQYLDLAIDAEVAAIFETNDVKTFLFENLRKKNSGEMLSFLSDKTTELINQKINTLGDHFYELYKMLMLESYNTNWVDHLEHMQDIREGIGLQGYAQKDPLVEYKALAYTAFNGFLDKVNQGVTKRLLKVQRVNSNQPTLSTNEELIKDIDTGDREFIASESKQIKADSLIQNIEAQASREKQIMARASGNSAPSVGKSHQAGRNDPCPCGSGKKYKKCGMINSSEHQKNMATK